MARFQLVDRCIGHLYFDFIIDFEASYDSRTGLLRF